jgi:hypothetical protein
MGLLLYLLCCFGGLLPAESLDHILFGRRLYEASCRGAEPGSRPPACLACIFARQQQQLHAAPAAAPVATAVGPAARY